LVGETASFANYTSYSKGINGIMVDIAGLIGTPGINDFTFKTGNSSDVASWTNAPPPLSISVRAGAGADGSSRVTILWPNNAIQKQWLQVTVRATAVTGLGAADLFYFGNAIGESGNSAADARVNATDGIAARNNPRATGQAPIDFRYDYNRDRRVNATDEISARNNPTSSLTALQLIHVPQVITGAASSSVAPAIILPLTAAPSTPVGPTVRIEGDGRLELRLRDFSGRTYLPEAAESLTRPAWAKLAPPPPLTQSGDAFEFVLAPKHNSPMRFCRVLMPIETAEN